ncbi:MAG: hypothetical protein D6691_10460 [Candidatus Hydrogenedentota bacterium]|jgi:hypothetical protein|nr:MAG: hypothetical protein D6691_10460 [Candidatus Hydrogenedentota bacterium]GIX44734.1 MAG: hypothetical protein KatS3mg130_1142 [Candidatus Sumerlaea sp.]
MSASSLKLDFRQGAAFIKEETAWLFSCRRDDFSNPGGATVRVRRVCALFLTIFLLGASITHGAPAFFAVNGQLLRFDGNVAKRASVRSTAPLSVQRVWGAFREDTVVATLGPSSAQSASEGFHDGQVPAGGQAVLLDADGTVRKVLADGVLRAFPSPSTECVALVFVDRSLALWREDALTTLSLPGKVSHLAWSPDSTRMAVVVYPPDWSENAVNNARTTADFLRLQQSKILLVDALSHNVLATLVDDGGTNYNPFFSPDGSTLYYIHLDVMRDDGGLFGLQLNAPEPASPVQLTQVGEGEGGVPIGRVGTYRWLKGGQILVFEAGKPDGSGVIWQMSSNGTRAAPLSVGRFPQPLDEARVAVLGADQTPMILSIREDNGR